MVGSRCWRRRLDIAERDQRPAGNSSERLNPRSAISPNRKALRDAPETRKGDLYVVLRIVSPTLADASFGRPLFTEWRPTMSEPTRVIPRRAVVSWITYDLANVIFSMGVTSLYFSLFVRAVVGSEHADSLVGRVSAVSMGIMFCLSPLLGAMTDRARRRMPFLMWATIICCAMTALIGRGPFALSMLAFVIANGGYQAGVQFYDSLLPEVTTEENRGRINGIAIGLGYLGLVHRRRRRLADDVQDARLPVRQLLPVHRQSRSSRWRRRASCSCASAATPIRARSSRTTRGRVDASDRADAQVGPPVSRARCASSSAARSIRTRSTP